MARNKYSSFLKEQIISDYQNGLSQKQISEKFSICKSVISRIICRFRSTESVVTVHSEGRLRKTSHRTDKKNNP